MLAPSSTDDQAEIDTDSLALGELNDAETAELKALSDAYREKFSRPLVMCMQRVAGRSQLIARGWHAGVLSSRARVVWP
ncbi:2-oxo-4-hydroxy-4-carboxy-5-ureidoimidazoline decarboxylase [Actinomyces trachealis]|uniref:2-oxo-4-hydroxy-4-carboxy-5-ureidoimidazoline decarboxylase n=1 Tax=Actinomyces trachealis TaxID=2763540 RepID=UPI001FD4D2EC|nr:2-oxo-4-hydroxy-4-carboxy-5-ureidoimidazoline decarboxylase [Actinomyces trachealis]